MKKIILTIVLLLCISVFTLPAEESRERGLELAVKSLDSNSTAGKQWLVLIAINKYDEWPNLRNPVSDANELAEVLCRRYYFDEVISLYNTDATRRNIAGLFLDLQKNLGVNDSLLIFYAGHGYLDKNSNSGFWIPSDAGKDDVDQKNWLPNTQVRGYISRIKSGHICLVIDACFSGDMLELTRGMPEKIENDYFSKAYRKTSRQVLTSGALETVPDNSEFAMLLKFALEKNTQPYLDPLMLFDEIRLGMNKTTPLLGNLKLTGHQEGASFLLFLKTGNKQTDEGDKNALQSEEKGVAESEEKKTAYGKVKVSVKKGGDLYIDDQFSGTIADNTTVVIEKITEGMHSFALRIDKEWLVAGTLEITAGKIPSISFEREIDIPIDAFVFVKGGQFTMGSKDRNHDERPVHPVSVSDFYMSKNEVTFDEYDDYCRKTGKKLPDDRGWGRGNRPVIFVSWYDAIAYCNWISMEKNLVPCYVIDGKNVSCDFSANGYRLPTEAEWEYAAGGGKQGRGRLYAGSYDAGEAGWYSQNSERQTHPAGAKKPNELGLYDMSGNVWEWCWDMYSEDYYADCIMNDPHGPGKGKNRVLRGGSWYNRSNYCTVTARGFSDPGKSDDYFGFRICRNAE